jgi:hypothetical protein
MDFLSFKQPVRNDVSAERSNQEAARKKGSKQKNSISPEKKMGTNGYIVVDRLLDDTYSQNSGSIMFPTIKNQMESTHQDVHLPMIFSSQSNQEGDPQNTSLLSEFNQSVFNRRIGIRGDRS